MYFNKLPNMTRKGAPDFHL